MEMPSILQGESLTRLMQGAAVGVVAAIVIGFSWGGWTLGSTATKMVEESSKSAVVAALVPICMQNFQSAPEAKATMVQLKAVDSWKQETFIEKGGWATFAGKKEPYSSVAEACAKALSALK